MDIELLAKKMRDRAIVIELEETALKAGRKSRELPKPVYKSVQDRIIEMHKIYFNAGRWAAGARDYTARVAAQKLEAQNDDF